MQVSDRVTLKQAISHRYNMALRYSEAFIVITTLNTVTEILPILYLYRVGQKNRTVF